MRKNETVRTDGMALISAPDEKYEKWKTATKDAYKAEVRQTLEAAVGWTIVAAVVQAVVWGADWTSSLAYVLAFLSGLTAYGGWSTHVRARRASDGLYEPLAWLDAKRATATEGIQFDKKDLDVAMRAVERFAAKMREAKTQSAEDALDEGKFAADLHRMCNHEWSSDKAGGYCTRCGKSA